ncbi:hypothetical protein E9993_01615 [Labilibacter sediminis]|nr:hypothetical protein E9993_01615 [Labilibacter sediminis]
MKEDIESLQPVLVVTIEGIDYKLQKSNRAKMVWENIINKSLFELDYNNENEVYYLFFQLLKCRNKNFNYSFGDFLDLIDDEKINIPELGDLFSSLNEVDGVNEDEEVKKKVDEETPKIWVRDLYGICIEMGISPKYFLDEMSDIELNAILQQYQTNQKNESESTRLIMYSNLAPYSENLKVTDVLKFPWDNESNYITEFKNLTKEEREELFNRGEKLLKRINETKQNNT